ncbi:unnamed protein product, partial [Nesidiocoris tenuis]
MNTEQTDMPSTVTPTAFPKDYHSSQSIETTITPGPDFSITTLSPFSETVHSTTVFEQDSMPSSSVPTEPDNTTQFFSSNDTTTPSYNPTGSKDTSETKFIITSPTSGTYTTITSTLPEQEQTPKMTAAYPSTMTAISEPSSPFSTTLAETTSTTLKDTVLAKTTDGYSTTEKQSFTVEPTLDSSTRFSTSITTTEIAPTTETYNLTTSPFEETSTEKNSGVSGTTFTVPDLTTKESSTDKPEFSDDSSTSFILTSTIRSTDMAQTPSPIGASEGSHETPQTTISETQTESAPYDRNLATSAIGTQTTPPFITTVFQPETSPVSNFETTQSIITSPTPPITMSSDDDIQTSKDVTEVPYSIPASTYGSTTGATLISTIKTTTVRKDIDARTPQLQTTFDLKPSKDTTEEPHTVSASTYDSTTGSTMGSTAPDSETQTSREIQTTIQGTTESDSTILQAGTSVDGSSTRATWPTITAAIPGATNEPTTPTTIGRDFETETSSQSQTTSRSEVETETTSQIQSTTDLSTAHIRNATHDSAFTTVQPDKTPGSTLRSRSMGTTEPFGAVPLSTFGGTMISSEASTIATNVETQTFSRIPTTDLGTTESQTKILPTTIRAEESGTAPGATYSTKITTLPTTIISNIESGTSQGTTEKSDSGSGSSYESTTPSLEQSTIKSDFVAETTTQIRTTTDLATAHSHTEKSQITSTTLQQDTEGSTYATITSTMSASSVGSIGTTQPSGAVPGSTFD